MLRAATVVHHSPTGTSRRRAARKGGRVTIRMPVSGLCLSASIRQRAQTSKLRAGQSVRCSLRIGPSQEDSKGLALHWLEAESFPHLGQTNHTGRLVANAGPSFLSHRSSLCPPLSHFITDFYALQTRLSQSIPGMAVRF